MKYSVKIPKTDEALSEHLKANGWTRLKEPQNFVTALLFSLPFMAVGLGLTILVSLPFQVLQQAIQGLSSGFNFSIELPSLLIGLVSMYFFVILHELLHAVAIPNFLHSKKTYWGITWQGGFVSTTEEMSKGRFCLISCLPFIILSLVLPVILGLMGKLSLFILFLACINGMGSSIDLLNLTLILFQVPNDSSIINNGFETYYK